MLRFAEDYRVGLLVSSVVIGEKQDVIFEILSFKLANFLQIRTGR